jgi:FkbM family methyltransferase
MIIKKLLAIATRVAESHPYIWKLAWEAVHRLPFLLPHDQSYHALRHFIRAAPNGLFLDIGANDGISALSLRKFDKGYRILSLEPNSMLEPSLAKIKANDPKFDYMIVGAGSEPSRLQFFVPIYHGIVLHTFTSSDAQRVHDGIVHSFGKSVAASTVIKSVESDVIRVDDLNIAPSIIKIDAEGFDFEVLRGLDQTLARARPFVVTEIAWAEEDQGAERFLRAHDYVVLDYHVASDRFRLVTNQTDTAGMNRSFESGSRNYFAVPRESLGDLPVEMTETKVS